MRIAFYGPMCSGKTYCAEYLVKTHGFYKIAFAAKLKEVAANLFNVHNKDGRSRIVLQQLGQKMREIDPNVWVNLAIGNLPDNPDMDLIVIDDLRYVNEAVALRAKGFVLIRVEAIEEVRQARIKYLYPDTPPESFGHDSEQEWRLIEPDYIVVSDDFYTGQAIENILAGKVKAFSESEMVSANG